MARTRLVLGDQFESHANIAEASRRGLQFAEMVWTNETKGEAVDRVRSLLRDNAIRLPKDESLRKELHSFSEIVRPSGTISYGARRWGHDDRVACILTAAMGDMAGLIPRSPLRPNRGARYDIGGVGWG